MTGVSVIIPAYNYAHYLPAAIDSVLIQDYPAVEVIVIDDGSTDNTKDVVAGYGEKVRYIYQDNAGLSTARNTGVHAARHEFAAFLDADDLWRPNMLSRLMAQVGLLPPGFSVVACRNERIDAHGTVLPATRRDAAFGGEIRAADILVKNRFSADAVVARREELLRHGGFDTALRSAEDRDMWIRMAQTGRIFLVPEPLLQVRMHPGSMSTHAERMKQNDHRVLRKAFQRGYVPKWRVILWLRALSFNYFQCAWMFRDENRHRTAIYHMIISMLLWPFFSGTARLNEPPLFRLRALRRFVLKV